MQAMRRLSFWLAVGGVSILAHFGLEAAAANVNSPGLARFTGFTHRGQS